MTTAFAQSKLVLPELPYDYGDLEPVISGEIMEIHHTKHHAAYVNNYNALAEKMADALDRDDTASAIALMRGLKFNGGGHVNHSIFWTNLAPKSQGGGEPPTGPLADAIDKRWGSLGGFIEAFNGAAGPIQGSGWGWLGYCSNSKSITIRTCANQDPLSTRGFVPLLGIDVWEHAYYLQYKNARPAYLKAIWDVINWKNVAERYESATS